MNRGIILSSFLILAFDLCAMEKDAQDNQKASLKKSVEPSYLQRLTADAWRALFPYFSYPTALQDNRGDAIMQINARARQVAELALRYCDFDLASDKAVNKNFIRASEFYVKQHELHSNSFFLPNHISLACALGTPGACEALKEEIKEQMISFKSLSQYHKNKLFLDVMRRCPERIIVKKMIKNGAEVNIQASDSKYTALRFAVEAENYDVVKLLLRHGAQGVTDRFKVTPLMRAIILGYSGMIKRLTRHNASTINMHNIFGDTALSYAARKGDPCLVQLLLDYGARTDISDEKQEKNVFVCAVEGGSYLTLHLLLNARQQVMPPINFINMYLQRALRRAAELGREDMVRYILWASSPVRSDLPVPALNLCPDMNFEDGSTALTVSLKNEHPHIAKILINFAKERYYKGWEPYASARSLALAWTVFKSQDLEVEKPEKAQQFMEVLDMLLDDDRPNPLDSNLSISACYCAARIGNKPLLDKLLVSAQLISKNCKELALIEAINLSNVTAVETVLKLSSGMEDCNLQNETLFFRAVTCVKLHALKIIDLLMQYGADPGKANRNDETAVHALMHNPDEKVRIQILHTLYKKAVPLDLPDVWGNTPLHEVCTQKPFMNEVAELLLQYGANSNAQNKDGNTPLMNAIGCGNKALAEKLLEYGADPNKRNNSGCGPLTKAARLGDIEFINKLIIAGAHLEGFQDSMLRQAAKRNHNPLVEVLIKNGANINGESTSFGNTPLHKTVASKTLDATKLLLKNNVDTTRKNRKGETPLELATIFDNAEAAEILLEY